MNEKNILVINPGSTSTKIAVFRDEEKIVERTLCHAPRHLSEYPRVIDQLPFRKDAVLTFLVEEGIGTKSLSCIVARGGLLKPIPGGAYLVDEPMCRELRTTKREHASNLAALIAKDIADPLGIKAFIVDPVVVDEMAPIAKISGLKGVERISIFHALNQKESCRKAALKLGRKYEDCRFIVAHMGGGISVGTHEKGKVIDVNNALDGDGPFSPERSGSLPNSSIVDLSRSGDLTRKEVIGRMVGKGGLVSYLGTNDGQAVDSMIDDGNKEAELIFEAMAYQIAKEIGSASAVLRGKVDAVILSGGLAYSPRLTNWIKERIGFIAPVIMFPGEGEMEAMAASGLRLLRGEEDYNDYGEAISV